ncbi:predicted protein [Uncinocarpus reesii 1704]|uniref:Serine hydrolase domain-containing protein n=1 Tax=Uncinocarpus reesii (strain UAMH 1704) TaxID=336963 RepID=C4JMT2_UNCRE|nr:uncharacterized protein UREG_04140 [Uncinocarpus reesii 1704]EEP79294.1 predicted protein [Uncinocarpus reesii 1704]
MADPTLHLPRLLCLHGAGSNAAVFRSQCRSLIPLLQSHFRLCFADGPFICEPGPGIALVYGELAPFRRWLRWRPGFPPLTKLDDGSQLSDEDSYEAVEKSILGAMQADDDKGATGEWVGLLGFSQGAKLSASLLFRQQVRAERLGRDHAGSNYRFAVLMNGPAPVVGFEKLETEDQKLVLRIPTLHVHALRDPDLPYHQMLKTQYCDEGTATVVEWNGDHRVPLAAKDIAPVADRILGLAKQTGALQN